MSAYVPGNSAFRVVSSSHRTPTPGVEFGEYLFDKNHDIIGRIIERGERRTVAVVVRQVRS